MLSNSTTSRPSHGLRNRLQGPGGLYNMGNAVGLIVGIALQVKSAGNATFLVGSSTALALTFATTVFFISVNCTAAPGHTAHPLMRA
jgi:hypothetical protein